MLSSHVWLMATALDSTDVECFCHHRSFHWTDGAGLEEYGLQTESMRGSRLPGLNPISASDWLRILKVEKFTRVSVSSSVKWVVI